MRRFRAFLSGALLCAAGGAAAVSGAVAQATEPVDPALYSGLRWRLAGPFRGGRALAAIGIPGEPNHFYFGSVGGGVWETRNAGRTWEPVFDGQPIASIGAIAAAPSDPRVLYVGSGEADMRSDISYGNGVYRSADGGNTWAHAGLADSRQIGRILVDPRDPNLVFVAALGHGYGPNAERGVFRSKDGGRTWSRVLHRDDDTGAIDLAFAPGNPRTILAALWQTRRPPWNVYPPSKGPGSGMYRSDDGGDTWRPVTGKGLPAESLGRIGIAFAPSDGRRVYALVDAKEGGLYASRDGGESWARVSPDTRIWGRGWYFGGVTVDPKNPDTVYACNTSLYRSSDGGRTFLPFKGAPGGDDYHHLWIDPDAPARMVLASDQGTVVTLDGGRTWSSWYNQPTAQLYHVITDDRFPYWLYGAQQDSGAVATPAWTDYRGIMLRDWRPIAAGGESGYIAPDPGDPNVLFGGGAGRFDQTTLQEQNVDPTLAYPGEYRGEWTLPLTFSARDPRVLYFGNQFVFRTADGGRHWEKISPDLTRENPPVPGNLDSLTAADSAVRGSRRGVVYAIAPSPVRDGLLWCGTDDGRIHVTRDEGKKWADVTPPDLTPWSKIGILEASHFDADTAYAAVDRHRLDDLAPYLYRTRDGGKTWVRIVDGLPAAGSVNVVREDPARRGLLFAGTELSIYVSFDDGDRWQPLQLNLPTCSVRDIAIRRGDLAVATHGRSFWILDDITPLEQLVVPGGAPAAGTARNAAGNAWLFRPREAVRLRPAGFQGTPEPKDEPAADNPSRGAWIHYALKKPAGTPLTIEIVSSSGELVRRWASDDPVPASDLQTLVVTPDWADPAGAPPASAGMHRLVWDLRDALPEALRQPSTSGASISSGAWSPPGRYTVRMTADGTTLTQPLVVVLDPRSRVSDADLVLQHDLVLQIEQERGRLARAIGRSDAIRRQLATRRQKAAGSAASGLASFEKRLDAVTGPPPDADREGELEEPPGAVTLRRAAASLAALEDALNSADSAPTPDARAGLPPRRESATQAMRAWEAVLGSEVPKWKAAIAAAGLPPLADGD